LINKRISLQENDYDHTDAEAILQTLKDEPNITYFAMYAESANSPLFTINQTQSARVADNNNIKLSGYVQVYGNDQRTKFTPHLDSALQKTVSQLLVKTNKDHNVKVLLSVGWARDEDLRILRKFPEVLKMDCTFNTNKEKCPLFNLVCKDSNNKLCTLMRCLLPSEKAAIFQSILVTILPQILGRSTCSKIHRW
jgi:hypothetical protein